MKYYRAVTLIEMMTVIAIIGIITSVTIVSFQSGRADSRLRAAQREVAATIKLAQGYALQGKTQAGEVPCGYGFRFTDTDSYEIFYNLLTGYTDCTEQNEVAGKRHWIDAESIQAEPLELNNGVVLNTAVDVNDNFTEIFFTVPHANAYKNDGSLYDSPKIIEFNFAGIPKSITINEGGFVSESN